MIILILIIFIALVLGIIFVNVRHHEEAQSMTAEDREASEEVDKQEMRIW